MDIFKVSAVRGDEVDFLDLVDSSNPKLREKLERFVDKCGGPFTIFREQNGKTPLDYLDEAFKPLEQYRDEIAFVIDGSTTRGFTEPSQASLYCQHLGLHSAQSFDVSEACNGWARCIHLAFMLFQTTPELKDKYVLIINNEQPTPDKAIVPQDLTDYSDVVSYYVGLTFSTVCACTLLKASDNYSWFFRFINIARYASHISIPLPKVAKGFCPTCPEYSVKFNDQLGQFCLPRFHDPELRSMNAIQHVLDNSTFFDSAVCVTHTYTRYAWDKIFEHLKYKELHVKFPETGNLGSASAPYIFHSLYGPDGEKWPKGQNMMFMGVAAGGSDICVHWKMNVAEGDRSRGIVGKSTSNMSKMDINLVKLRVMLTSQKLQNTRFWIMLCILPLIVFALVQLILNFL